MAAIEGASLGFALGNVPGAIVGGAIGLGIDLFNFFTGASAQAQQTNVQTDYQIATTELQLTEANAKKAGYQSFLSKLPTAGETLQGSTGDPEFDAQYRSLLSNFGNMNVLAGATGNVGPGTSMALVQNQAKKDVSTFVDTQKEIATQQLGVLQTTVDTLNPVLTELQGTKSNPDLLTGIGNWLNTGKWAG